MKSLIHITSPVVAYKIEQGGFIPFNISKYKYYSDMGLGGIYFYDNLRLAQFYAYHFASKNKIDKVAVIRCEAPDNIIQSNNKLEDGLFIATDNLNKVVITSIDYKFPRDIY